MVPWGETATVHETSGRGEWACGYAAVPVRFSTTKVECSVDFRDTTFVAVRQARPRED